MFNGVFTRKRARAALIFCGVSEFISHLCSADVDDTFHFSNDHGLVLWWLLRSRRPEIEKKQRFGGLRVETHCNVFAPSRKKLWIMFAVFVEGETGTIESVRSTLSAYRELNRPFYTSLQLWAKKKHKQKHIPPTVDGDESF